MSSGAVLELEECATCLTCAYASKGVGKPAAGLAYCADREEVVDLRSFCGSWSWSALARSGGPVPVAVTDIHMSFSSIVVFMVKAAFAVLPALFIIIGICLFVISLFTGYAKYR